MYTLIDGGDILEKSNKNKKNDKSIETEQNKNQVITIFFESTDKKINYKLDCNKDSIFKDIEEKLNQEFAELRNVKKYYLCNGSQIDINKTFEENKIEDNSLILIVINNINKNDKSIEAKYNKKQVKTIFFKSTDQKINYKLNYNKDSIFKDIEEKLYQKFEELRNINKYYLCNGNVIDINKTFEENKIKDNSHILIVINDNCSINASLLSSSV